MGRPKNKANAHLPPFVFKTRYGVYFWTKSKPWERIGTTLPGVHDFVAGKLREDSGALDSLIDAAFARMKARKVDPLSKNTKKQYALAAKKLKKLLRKFSSPTQVKQKDAAQVKMLLAPTPNYANRVISFGRQVWADFVEQQVCDSNPFLGIRRHKEAKSTQTYTQAEFDAIYAHAGPRLQVIMDLLYLTDQRIGDVLKIDEAHLLEEGIYFKQQKTGKELVLRWTPQIREAVARARSLHGTVEPVNFKSKDRPLLRNRRGKAPDYSTVKIQWDKARVLAGMPGAKIHSIRAMSASDVQRQGGNPQESLGHEDKRTTQIYLRGLPVQVVDGPVMKRSA